MHEVKSGETSQNVALAHHFGLVDDSLLSLAAAYWRPLILVFLPFSAGYFFLSSIAPSMPSSPER